MNPENTLSEKTIYNGKMLSFSLREATLADGTRVNREIVSTKGAVVIVALTEQNEVRLVKQFRAAAQKWIIELPAGTLNPVSWQKKPAIQPPTGNILAASIPHRASSPSFYTSILPPT